MGAARTVDSTLRRRRFHRLRNIPKWRVELFVRPGVTCSGEAGTVEGAWNAAAAGAQILWDIEVTSSCPWNEKGDPAEVTASVEEPEDGGASRREHDRRPFGVLRWLGAVTHPSKEER